MFIIRTTILYGVYTTFAKVCNVFDIQKGTDTNEVNPKS